MIDLAAKREIREIANKIRATGWESWLFNQRVNELIARIETLVAAAYEQGKGDKRWYP